MGYTVLQLLPELEVGGVEQGTLEIADALVAAGHRALVVSGGGRLVSKLSACGAEHITLAVGRKHLSSLFLVRRLRDLIAHEKVDIVHARSRLPAWLGWLAIRGMSGARPHWVTTVHGPYTVNRYSRIMVSGTRVIAISEFIRDYVTRNYSGIAASRVVTIPRGVDPAHYAYGFRPAQSWLDSWRLEHPELVDKQLLTLPGRLTRWKGQQDFIRMMRVLRASNLAVHGLLVGGPHPRKRQFEEELKCEIAAAGLQTHVSLLGNRADLREILSISAAAFSLTLEPEAFGRTTIEALSLGVPVIGYDHGGTGEILRKVYPAGLVPVGDVDAVAARIRTLLTAPISVPPSHPYTQRAMQTATLAVYDALMAV